MLAPEPAIDIAGGERAWRRQIYTLGNALYIDRLLLADAPKYAVAHFAALKRILDREAPDYSH